MGALFAHVFAFPMSIYVDLRQSDTNLRQLRKSRKLHEIRKLAHLLARHLRQSEINLRQFTSISLTWPGRGPC